ncbi:MAG: hypothetical protein FWC69_06325, partial [Defluviitaleaceae bacterium]|nr:hypothetical protein [Defluviitaleaceae bacterium]
MRKTMRKSLTAFTLVIFMILSSVTPIFSDGFTESMGWTMPPFEGQQVIMGAGGEAHSAAILADGSLWTWGVNNVGQIGDGTTINRNRPQRIMEDAIFVALGSGFTMAIKSDNSLWGWGWLVDGEIVHSPIKIMDDVIYVSAGFRYVMIIKADGSLLGWGRNNVGQLGDGTTIDRHSPIKIMDDVKYVSTGLGYFAHTMAIKGDGSLWGWGYNRHGQIGDGTTIDRHNPVMISNNVVSVSVGVSHTMAIGSNGSLWGWGQNGGGSLGDGTTIDRHSPILI